MKDIAKKTLAVCLASMLAVGGLTACGSGSAEDRQASREERAREELDDKAGAPKVGCTGDFSAEWVSTGNPAETVTLAVAAGALGFVVGWGLPAAKRARKKRSVRRAYLALPARTKELVDEAVRVGGLEMRVDSPDFVKTRVAEEAGLLVTTDEGGSIRLMTTPIAVAQAIKEVE